MTGQGRTPSLTCRCGHGVEQHQQHDPGWCRICESCQYDPKQSGRTTSPVTDDVVWCSTCENYHLPRQHDVTAPARTPS